MIEEYHTTEELVSQFLRKLEERVKWNSQNALHRQVKEFKPTL